MLLLTSSLNLVIEITLCVSYRHMQFTMQVILLFYFLLPNDDTEILGTLIDVWHEKFKRLQGLVIHLKLGIISFRDVIMFSFVGAELVLLCLLCPKFRGGTKVLALVI